MNETISGLKPGLHISAGWVIAAMAAVGVGLGLASQAQSHFAGSDALQDLALLVFLLTLLTWGLHQWQPGLGRWGVVISLVLAVYWGQHWLQTPGFLVLLVIPTALAAALIGLPAALLTAGG